MKKIKLLKLSHFLPFFQLILLCSCNQVNYEGLNNYGHSTIPTTTVDETRLRADALSKEFDELCKKLECLPTSSTGEQNEENKTLNLSKVTGELLDCNGMKNVLNLPFCKATPGEVLENNTVCSCNDVCNPEEITSHPIDNIEPALNAMKDVLPEGVRLIPQGYSVLKAMAARVDFNANNKRDIPESEKRLQAVRIIESIESGARVGTIEGFNDLADFMKFVQNDEVFKSRMKEKISEIKKYPNAREDEVFNEQKLTPGDIIRADGREFIVEKKNNVTCLKEAKSEECSSAKNMIKELRADRKKPIKISLNYQTRELEAEQIRLQTSCIIKTKCTGIPSHIQTDELKVTFNISDNLSSDYKEKLPAAIHCMKKIPMTEGFEKDVMKAFPSEGAEILKKIRTTEKTINLIGSSRFGSRVLASTPCNGDVYLNNNKDRTVYGLTNTLMHEYMHNLGYKHGYQAKSNDVSYGIGNIVESLAPTYCPTSVPSTVAQN